MDQVPESFIEASKTEHKFYFPPTNTFQITLKLSPAKKPTPDENVKAH